MVGDRLVRVTLHRHGGFAAVPGLDVHVCLDSQDLPDDDARVLEAAVRQAGLDQLPPPPAGSRPDGRIYDLDVEDSDRSLLAQVTDPLPTPEVATLVKLLLDRGSPLT